MLILILTHDTALLHGFMTSENVFGMLGLS